MKGVHLHFNPSSNVWRYIYFKKKLPEGGTLKATGGYFGNGSEKSRGEQVPHAALYTCVLFGCSAMKITLVTKISFKIKY